MFTENGRGEKNREKMKVEMKPDLAGRVQAVRPGWNGDLGEARSKERKIDTATEMAHLPKCVLICGCLDDVNTLRIGTNETWPVATWARP